VIRNYLLINRVESYSPFYLHLDKVNSQFSSEEVMKFIPTRILNIGMLLLLAAACRDDPQRHLKLGQWYAQKGLIEEAILEFHEVTRLYPVNPASLNREDYQTLSQAHYNLSLMYSKKGWWDYALKEAETCFQMQPTKDYFDLLTLIKNRATLEEDNTGS